MVSIEEKQFNSFDNLLMYLINTKQTESDIFSFLYRELNILPELFEKQVELYVISGSIQGDCNKRYKNFVNKYKTIINKYYKWCEKHMDLSEIQTISVEKLKLYQSLVTDYIVEDQNSIKKFCDTRNMTELDFIKGLSHLAKQAPKYYESFLSFLDSKIISTRLKAKQLGDEIILNILNNDNYDIIDFAGESNISISQMINIVGHYWNSKEMKILRDFDARNRNQKKYNRLDIIQLFNRKEEINCQRDENDLPIPETGRVITNEEKAIIISYIQDRPSIFLGEYTYNLAKRKYFSDELFKDKVIEKVRTREK